MSNKKSQTRIFTELLFWQVNNLSQTFPLHLQRVRGEQQSARPPSGWTAGDLFCFFPLSAEPAAVTASGVESDISDLPRLMIRDASERAACLVIYRGKQIEETSWWLCKRHHLVFAQWRFSSRCLDVACCLSCQVLEKMMLHWVSLKLVRSQLKVRGEMFFLFSIKKWDTMDYQYYWRLKQGVYYTFLLWNLGFHKKILASQWTINGLIR